MSITESIIHRGMIRMFEYFNSILVMWAMRKYRRLKEKKVQACLYIERCARERPGLFMHWQQGKPMMTA